MDIKSFVEAAIAMLHENDACVGFDRLLGGHNSGYITVDRKRTFCIEFDYYGRRGYILNDYIDGFRVNGYMYHVSTPENLTEFLESKLRHGGTTTGTGYYVPEKCKK